MELDELLHQRQPDARPLVRAPARVLDAVEPLEDAVDLLGRNADARVAHRPAPRRRPRAASDDGNLALEGELERVGQEVEDDLLPHLTVDVDGLGQRRAVARSAQSPARSQAERKMLARSAVTAARSVGSYAAWTRPASIREKSSSVFTSFCSRRPLRWTTVSSSRSSGSSWSPGLARSVLERPEHERERRTELVAHVAEERGLGAVQLGQGFGAAGAPPRRRARSPMAAETRAGGEVEEVAIVAGQPEEPAHAGDQRARRSACPTRSAAPARRSAGSCRRRGRRSARSRASTARPSRADGQGIDVGDHDVTSGGERRRARPR